MIAFATTTAQVPLLPFGPFLAGGGLAAMFFGGAAPGACCALARLGLTCSAGPAAAEGRLGAIGLTGGIGSGKSTVAARLVERGAELVDTDAIARSLTLAGRRRDRADPRSVRRRLHRCRRRARPGAHARGRLRRCRGAAPSRVDPASAASARGRAPGRWPRPHRSPCSTFRCWSNPAAGAAASTGSGSSTAPRRCSSARVMARSGWTESAVRAVIAQQATRVRPAAPPPTP